MLIGEFQHTIDAKKRMSVPAKLRKELGKGAVITRGIDNCLVIYPLKEWKVMSSKLGKLTETQHEARGFARIKLAGATVVNFDSLGRVLIPEYLKKYACLNKDAVIIGLYNRLEVWDVKKWEKYRAKIEKGESYMKRRMSEAQMAKARARIGDLMEELQANYDEAREINDRNFTL